MKKRSLMVLLVIALMVVAATVSVQAAEITDIAAYECPCAS